VCVCVWMCAVVGAISREPNIIFQPQFISRVLHTGDIFDKNLEEFPSLDQKLFKIAIFDFVGAVAVELTIIFQPNSFPSVLYIKGRSDLNLVLFPPVDQK